AAPAGGKAANGAKSALTPRLLANLRAARAKVALSRQLVRLETNVPLEADWDAWRLRDWDAPKLLALFQEWGFRGVAGQVRQSSVARGPLPAAPAEAPGTPPEDVAQGELFPFGANVEDAGSTAENGQPTTDKAWQAKYELVDTPAKFKKFLGQLKKQRRIAVDLETTGLQPLQSDVVGFAVCWQPGEAYYLAVRAPEGKAALDPAA